MAKSKTRDYGYSRVINIVEPQDNGILRIMYHLEKLIPGNFAINCYVYRF